MVIPARGPQTIFIDFQRFRRQAFLGSRVLAAELGKSRQDGGEGTSWVPGYWQLGSASLGKSRQVGQAIGSWARQVQASRRRWEILCYRLLAVGLGKSRQAGGDGQSWVPGYWQLG